VKEGFTNQKKNNSDEFLVEKKSPLVMPPNYDELPLPKKSNTENNLETNEIKILLTKQKINIDNSESEKNINPNFIESLLKKIKKD
jgi:hypothetical protein